MNTIIGSGTVPGRVNTIIGSGMVAGRACPPYTYMNTIIGSGTVAGLWPCKPLVGIFAGKTPASSPDDADNPDGGRVDFSEECILALSSALVEPFVVSGDKCRAV
jgi:hypothetical protein